MIERMCVNVSDTNCISVEFNDQIFNLEFAGDYNEFVNNFIPMFKDFANGVIEEYLKTLRPDPDKRYRECLAEWYQKQHLSTIRIGLERRTKMIKIENVRTAGWEPAIRGARNPMNSWEKSDSWFSESGVDYRHNINGTLEHVTGSTYGKNLEIGPNDLKLLSNLAKAGSDEAKFRRMIVVYLDVTAPMYWWKEADTYKVGTVRNSCSTMHKIHAKEFTLDDFSCEHLLAPEYFSKDDEAANDCGLYAYEISPDEEATKNILNEYEKVNFFAWPENSLEATVKMLNKCRELYLETNDKRFWWQMIQLLPSSYNQRATLMLNYEVLANMYHARKNHKLDEWREFCKWIETLPYAKELIVGEETVTNTEEQIKARFKSYEDRIRYLEELSAKEFYRAYDMSVEDISEKIGIPESAVKYFISDDMPISPLLDPAYAIGGDR